MKIVRSKLELALAKNCMALSDLRDGFSSTTLTRMMKEPSVEVRPQTIGRLAKALNCQVEDLIDNEKGA